MRSYRHLMTKPADFPNAIQEYRLGRSRFHFVAMTTSW